jgi:hypothetical protein
LCNKYVIYSYLSFRILLANIKLWKFAVKILHLHYAENYKRKMFDLLTIAYSTITVSDAAHFLGMSEEDASKCMFILIFCAIILGILLLELF